jgi:mono/diheme cytochrome c family protein
MPDSTDATAAVTLQELAIGRNLYTQRCGSCHTLYLPGHLNDAGWRTKLNEMQPKARIADAEKELILKYILRGRARTATAGHAGPSGTDGVHRSTP